MAGLPTDYLIRLEQGRATHPSSEVLSALARALRLTDQERDHLVRLAGQASPRANRIGRHHTPGVQHLLDRLVDVAVTVYDASWELIAWNPLTAALFGEPASRPGRDNRAGALDTPSRQGALDTPSRRVPSWYHNGMSKQIAVRLPDELVDFVDKVVGSGAERSRATFVARALERERRRLNAERDAEVLAGAGADRDLHKLAEHAAGLAHGLD